MCWETSRARPRSLHKRPIEPRWFPVTGSPSIQFKGLCHSAQHCTAKEKGAAVLHWGNSREVHQQSCISASKATRFWNVGTPGKIPCANPAGPLSNHRFHGPLIYGLKTPGALV